MGVVIKAGCEEMIGAPLNTSFILFIKKIRMSARNNIIEEVDLCVFEGVEEDVSLLFKEYQTICQASVDITYTSS